MLRRLLVCRYTSAISTACSQTSQGMLVKGPKNVTTFSGLFRHTFFSVCHGRDDASGTTNVDSNSVHARGDESFCCD